MLEGLRNIFLEAVRLDCDGSLAKEKFDILVMRWNKEIDYIQSCFDNLTSITPIRTNADRIRALTNDDLAKLIAYEGCPLDGRSCCHTPLNYDNCYSCWLEWLKQEVKE